MLSLKLVTTDLKEITAQKRYILFTVQKCKFKSLLTKIQAKQVHWNIQ